MNALFNGVDKNIFRLISNCTIAKNAWDILTTTHEGTSKVKMSKLQLITTKFENLKMGDDESILDFHMNIIELENTSGALGERMSEEKLVRKILRSLSKRFNMKVIVIEEARDIKNMKVEELIGSLQTYEMETCDHIEERRKGIALQSNTYINQTKDNLETDEEVLEALALIGRQFNNILKKINRRRGLMSETFHLKSIMDLHEKRELIIE